MLILIVGHHPLCELAPWIAVRKMKVSTAVI